MSEVFVPSIKGRLAKKHSSAREPLFTSFYPLETTVLQNSRGQNKKRSSKTPSNTYGEMGLSENQGLSVILSNGIKFNHPEERIREYCDVEVYIDRNYRGGYDDRNNVTGAITKEDLEAANNLYARMSTLDFRRILGSADIIRLLPTVRDAELGAMNDGEWNSAKATLRQLLSAFISIQNVKLAKVTKVLHLKRPHLVPILDSYVVKFLTGNDMEENTFSEEELLAIALESLQTARGDIVKNRAAFDELQRRLGNLPTTLTIVRMYDILCWTQEKWVNRRETEAPYGVAKTSLDQSASPAPSEPAGAGSAPTLASKYEHPKRAPHGGVISTTKEFRQIRLRAEGVIVITASSPPRVHRPLCDEVTEERFQTTMIFNDGKQGKYYLRDNLAQAAKEFGAVACKKCRPERPISPI